MPTRDAQAGTYSIIYDGSTGVRETTLCKLAIPITRVPKLGLINEDESIEQTIDDDPLSHSNSLTSRKFSCYNNSGSIVKTKHCYRLLRHIARYARLFIFEWQHQRVYKQKNTPATVFIDNNGWKHST